MNPYEEKKIKYWPATPSCACPIQSKNAVCALQITYKLFNFPLEKSCRNEQTINSLSQLKAVSNISNMC